MTRAMGVNCDQNMIYIAVSEEGTILPDYPERITTPLGLEEHDRLWALLEDTDRVLDGVKPNRVAILQPEQNYEARHSAFSPRIARETVVRMATARRGIAVEMVARSSVRSRLGLPMKGRFGGYLDTAVPHPVGHYWNTGRGLAAMAALAAEQS